MRFDLVPTNRLARVPAGRAHLPQLRQVEHLHQDVDRPVRHGGLFAQPVLKFEDVLALHLRHAEFSQDRHDVLAQHDAVVRRSRRFVVHVDVFALVALGEVGHGRLGLFLGEGLAGLDARDQPDGLLAGLVGRDLAVEADCHTLRLALRPGLNHVYLDARGVDADTEAREIRIPSTASLPSTARRSTIRLESVRYWRSGISWFLVPAIGAFKPSSRFVPGGAA